MNFKPLTMMAAIALAVLMTAPSSVGQGVPIIATGSDSDDNSWVTDGTGTWSNQRDEGNGNYFSRECSWIETSAPLPGALLAVDPLLTFDYTFSIERSTFSGFAYDGSVVVVSTDAGATWTPIATGLENSPSYGSSIRGCLDAIGSTHPDAVISGEGSGSASIDLSTVVAPTDLFQVRLVLATDFCCDRDGWNISGVTVAGVPLA